MFNLKMKSSCNGIPFTPKGEPGYIGVICKRGVVGGDELDLERNKYKPGFCQFHCNTNQIVRMTNVDEKNKTMECDCPDGKKSFPIINSHTWPYQCNNVPYFPDNQFCYNNRWILPNPQSKPFECDGVPYDYTKQECKEGKLFLKQKPKEYTWVQQAYQIPKP